jgi:ABC-type uncharacterized transport system involved in gliding motility auxiliary subunit
MSTSRHRSLLTGGTLAILAVLFVAVIVLVNFLFRGARLDLTESNLYTLSDGTREIVSSIEEPINLYYFFSDKNAADVPMLRNYATRVREMLEEIAGLSGGRIKLHVIDPLPFSEEEDRAASYGLQAIPYGNAGETIYFGLAGTNSTDGQMIIPLFDPQKEPFLEYDVAKLLHSLATTTKPVVAMLSTLDLAPGFDPATRQMKPGAAIFQSLQELFDVRQLSPEETKKIEDDVQTLVLVHPKLSDELAYAVDQFVLRGGHLLVFVDPDAETDPSGASVDPTQPAPSRSSDLPRLFAAWGLAYDPSRVVLDAASALQVQPDPSQPPVRHLATLGLRAASMNQKDVGNADLE